MPTYLTDLTPDWLKRLRPENASVFDSPGIKLARWIAGVTGVADPKAQVLGMMAPMETGPVGGLAGAIGDVVKGIRAYHGSPHDFEQFSLAKIGTGEGAQAYGHGLYFAEDPAVARFYRAINAPSYQNAGVQAIVDEAMNVAKQRGVPDADVRVFARNEIHKMAQGRPTYARQQYYDAANNLDAILDTPHGKMYQVDIAADPASFLDWDAPLSAQSPQVQETLRKMGIASDEGTRLKAQYLATIRDKAPSSDAADKAVSIATDMIEGRRPVTGSYAHQHWDALQKYAPGVDHNAIHDIRAVPPLTGEKIYESVPHVLADQGLAPTWSERTHFEDATDALRQAGIPGIKYLDAGSRAAGTGTRNYVVFDDTLVSIAKKYMLAGLGVEEAIRRAASDLGRPAPQTQGQGPS